MKVQIEAEVEDIVRDWLKECYQYYNTNEFKYKEDKDFWTQMGQLSKQMLELNWPHIK
jgi:hypothetical protein